VKELEEKSDSQRAVDAVAALPNPERRVLRLRFGLEGGKPTALRAVSDLLNVSGDDVRRIE